MSIEYEECDGCFLGIQTPYREASVCVVPVPYDGTSSYLVGSRRAPGAILEASAEVELFDEELLVDLAPLGFHTLAALEPRSNDPGDLVRQVARQVDAVLGDAKRPILLGGEHTVTVGAVEACLRHHPGLGVLQLDAHPDLRDSYQGSPLSHACVMRRVREMCPAVQVGLRTLSEEEWQYIGEAELSGLFFDHAHPGGAPIDAVLAGLPEEVYVTLDLDGLDPAIAPAVGTPVPGGYGWRATLDLLRAVGRQRKVIGFDLVELCPGHASLPTEFLAARLVAKMAAYSWAGPPSGDGSSGD